MHAFEIELEPAPVDRCRVHVGAGALGALVRDLQREPPEHTLVIVSDSNVAPLYAEPMRRRLDGERPCHLFTFPAGEAHKTRETKARLEDRLLEHGVGRDAALLAVGGGVTGDLAGFVAATWHRGIPLIQVPTSLLAMVDACLGGKTAVDLPRAKNLVGAFHQPRAIYADVATLTSLPDAEFVAGLAEVVKMAVIADGELFSWLERSVSALLARDGEALEHAVLRCLQLKGEVVREDARESGRREMLNFGHTLGHALESASGYSIAHGRAVSIGMVAEADLAERVGFSDDDRSRLRALLESCRLPVRLPPGVAIDEMLALTRRDKKVRRGTPRYALPSGLGSMPDGPDVCTIVDESRVRRTLAALTGPRR